MCCAPLRLAAAEKQLREQQERLRAMKAASREQKSRIKASTKAALDTILNKYERAQVAWEAPADLKQRIDEAIRCAAGML